MSKQSIYNMLASKAEPIKIDLALIDDFTKEYNQLLDEMSNIAKEIVDKVAMTQYQVKLYQQSAKKWDDVYKKGAKLESMAKELGTTLDPAALNKIEIAKRSISEDDAYAKKMLSHLQQTFTF
jgi:hypothetical protein